ncbi:MAG TPA: hypothetical protein VNH46_01525 [Gemmatimonadales bacterium]|nr:hypothetical protein [Gemmatimonadales bacterium]
MPKSRVQRRPRPASHHPGRSRAPFYCLGLLATLAACEILGPSAALPANAQLMAAPPAYLDWWTKTETCSGLAGHFDRIEWYVVPGAQSFETDLGLKVGLWIHSSDGVRIVIAGDYVGSELVVRHEMLHALLDREGHPAEYFQDRCQLTWGSWVQANGS